jgi:LysM repeat protein
MPAVRQAASGLIYGIVSLFLVVGSLSLALAQGGVRGEAAATFTPLPSSTSSPRPSPSVTGATEATSTQGVINTGTPGGTETPTRGSSDVGSPTITTPSQAAATATRVPAATPTAKAACGPPYGWVQSYVVRPGDTLYRIATSYGISVEALQRANCRAGTTIYVGERLWVPFAYPVATELTIIPTFPTPTEAATSEPVVPSATSATSAP